MLSNEDTENCPTSFPNDLKETKTSWNDSPCLVISKIFSLLNQNDVFHASLACRNWSQGIHTPCLWRSLVTEFNGIPFRAHGIPSNHSSPYMRDRNAIRCVQKYGQHLQNLHIIFKPNKMEKSGNLQEAVEAFFSTLISENCLLKTLKVTGSLISSLWNPAAKDEFLRSWNRFLKTQNKLESLEVEIDLVAEDIKLLEGLVTDSLTFLSFSFYFIRDPLSLIQKSYYKLLSNLPHLQHLQINWKSLDSTSLKILLQNSPKLHVIEIVTQRMDFTASGIPMQEWKRVCKEYPNLTVKMKGELPGLLSHVSILLTRGMPLIYLEIHVCEVFRKEVAWNLRQVLNYVRINFASSLVTFLFLDPHHLGFDEDLDDVVEAFIISCPKLKHLEIESGLSLLTVQDICEMQRNKQIGKIYGFVPNILR